MKYKLIIDKNVEEEIIAIVHTPSALTQQIENLVRSFSGADCMMGYRDEEMRKLSFGEIECITVLDRKVTAIDTKGNRFAKRRTRASKNKLSKLSKYTNEEKEKYYAEYGNGRTTR